MHVPQARDHKFSRRVNDLGAGRRGDFTGAAKRRDSPVVDDDGLIGERLTIRDVDHGHVFRGDCFSRWRLRLGSEGELCSDGENADDLRQRAHGLVLRIGVPHRFHPGRMLQWSSCRLS